MCRLILSITHSVASSLPLRSRNVRFLHAAFDAAGERFVAGDSQGNVFLFDIRGNKWVAVYNYVRKPSVHKMIDSNLFWALENPTV